jgi:electron transfer flavoprotein beta subunit
MNVLVCLKQIPNLEETEAKMNAETLVREGRPVMKNSFDENALEMAVRLKEATGGTVSVLTMGPAQVKGALQEAHSVGANKLYQLTDAAFAGSDAAATAVILSKAIAHIEASEGKFDIIFCGKEATDGATASVGPAVAEHLGLPQITFVSDIKVEGSAVKATRENNDGHEVIEANTPVLLTVSKTEYELRFPNVKSKLASLKAKIDTFSAGDIGVDAGKVGLGNAVVKVLESYKPERKKEGIIIKAETPEEAAEKLGALLNDRNII